MPKKIKYYVRDGSGSLFKLEPGGLYKWSGRTWEDAHEQAYRDFGDGAADYEEISESDARKRM